MDAGVFSHSPSGRLAPTTGGHAFVPNPLPPALDLSTLIARISEASGCIGELRGLGGQLANPHLLIRPFQRKEAVSSSSIEGTHTSLTDLLAFEIGADDKAPQDDNLEVLNYARALDQGINRLAELPICKRLICELHARLLRGVPLNRRSGGEPGEFKRVQNWIGGSSSNIALARFVPPPPVEAEQAMADLERFINDPDRPRIEPLVFIALVHYQFETIHPFPDGNGRVGRLLIPLLLHGKQILPRPLLYMSPFFEAHKDEYIDRMFEVSRSGDWNGWIDFFLTGMIESSRVAMATIRALLDLQASYKERLMRARSSALIPRLIDFIFERPVLSIPAAKNLLRITYRAAQQNVERLIGENILVEYRMPTRPKLFVAHEVLDILK